MRLLLLVSSLFVSATIPQAQAQQQRSPFDETRPMGAKRGDPEAVIGMIVGGIIALPRQYNGPRYEHQEAGDHYIGCEADDGIGGTVLITDLSEEECLQTVLNQ